MTLVITELSEFGVAMLADSAITFQEKLPSGKTIPYVLNGARKLQTIPYLGAGISAWGLGEMPFPSGNVSTDIWLSDFVMQNSRISSLNEFATALANELQLILDGVQIPTGFHLAGFEEINGHRLPTFYHIRNVDGPYQQYQFHEFIPGHDLPPRVIGRGDFHVTRNGDFGPYSALTEAVHQVLPIIKRAMQITIPHPSLEGRVLYHTAWIKFVSDLYASAELLRTIGGNVSSLAIYPQGQLVYAPSG